MNILKVLVTGGAGFIGSNVVDALVASGHEVAVLDNLSTGRREHVPSRVTFYQADLAGDDLDAIVAAERPQVVIHHAAQISVPLSVADPVWDATVNILGTLRLLQACLHAGVAKLIYASSAAVYGNPAYLPVDERHPIRPISPYGASKYAPELYIRMFAESVGMRHTILRYANVYGIRQDPQGEGGVVSVFVDCLLSGRRPVVFGDGEQTRDFIYVKDVAAANVAALTAGDGGTFNIGRNERTSVNQLLRTMSEVLGRELEPEHAPPRPGDIRHSSLANEAARAGLGWEPRYTLAAGLAETLDYYQRQGPAR
ncbi:NAD-dependent epimerase/dehydratase family protein [Alicyclobacillus shizuokensis]|uniref:NAD-dependent epimerase/dehydratase family protein n=1 Tax=Alicyclobacillus shizuokensis TaxID=392014 RepID=UPI000AED1C67|nr:NAD-dependent epimerase/dehydratase family protein [Alicyclobacillus shizuokensis]